MKKMVYIFDSNGITYIPYDGDSSKAWEIDMCRVPVMLLPENV